MLLVLGSHVLIDLGLLGLVIVEVDDCFRVRRIGKLSLLANEWIVLLAHGHEGGCGWVDFVSLVREG